MNMNDLFESKYLKGADFPTERSLTMRRISKEKLGDKVKPVLYFDEVPKGMVLNPTNGNIIHDIFGDPDNWWGKKITIYFDPMVEFASRRVGGLRCKAASNGQAKPGSTAGVWTVARAWAEFQKANSDLTHAEQQQAMRAACAAYFGEPFDVKDIRPDQWARFVQDGFAPVAAVNSEIPFAINWLGIGLSLVGMLGMVA